MNIHRNIIYKQRKNYLFKDEIKEDIIQMITESAENIVINNIAHRDAKDWNKKEIFEALTAIHKDDNALTQEQINTIIYEDELIEKAKSYLLEAYKKREKSLPDPKILRGIEKAVILRSTDTLWMDHIDTMQNLRESVAFSGYAQKDPLTEYKALSFELFNELMAMINSNTLNTLFKIDLEKVVPQEMLKRAEIKQIQTNDAEIEKPLSSKNPVIVKTSGATGSQLTERASTGGTVIHMSDKDSGPVVGRNDPCPCGSGKKHKKCCG